MAKRFCKLNRRDITEHLGEIHSLVTEPKFVCRSCARSSADQANLCKPTAIPPIDCQNKPVEEKAACGLLAETLPTPEVSLIEVMDSADPVVQIFDPATVEKADKVALKKAKLKKLMAVGDDKAELKRAKKAAKKQEKYNKKLAKMIKKQQKLFKKSQKLESDLERINLQLDDVTFTESKTQVVSHNHIH
ncbi:hypothetical protein [Vibrio bathopelagicus]|uniref:hypothetical protein n=1 Tax=Vibrio bathopelagicus TaxID=2777577 RepID=UPI001863D03D|nr:hypothetical protein [Vibrio bathopelagicus]